MDPEEGDAEERASKLRKKMGFPELDPDALPSAQITKYMILVFYLVEESTNKNCTSINGFPSYQ